MTIVCHSFESIVVMTVHDGVSIVLCERENYYQSNNMIYTMLYMLSLGIFLNMSCVRALVHRIGRSSK